MLQSKVLVVSRRLASGMSKQIFHSPDAPAALGPYSQAVAGSGKTVFVSGQLGLTKDGKMEEGVEAQTAQALRNMNAILIAAGGGLPNVVKTTVLLKDLADFDIVNAVYAQSFSEAPPARACFQVARLPKDGLVEIEAVAYV